MRTIKRALLGVLLIGALVALAVSLYPGGRATAQAFSDAMILRATGKLLIGTTTPTLQAGGFGTSPSVLSSNGPLMFRVNVGTGGSASTGEVALGTATNGWSCVIASPLVATYTRVTTSYATGVRVTNFNATVPAAWTASDTLTFMCAGY